MSKELEAFKRWTNACLSATMPMGYSVDQAIADKEIIETALKKQEQDEKKLEAEGTAMKYFRTNGGIIESSRVDLKENGRAILHYGTMSWEVDSLPILKKADTIDELIDVFILKDKNGLRVGEDYHRFAQKTLGFKTLHQVLTELTINKSTEIHAAIWTEWGLKYVAKMKGVLPNGEIDWELL